MPTTTGSVIVHDVCFAYDRADVLHAVSTELGVGEVTAIAGPNGSSKSTLIEIVAGVLRPSRGQVERSGDVALVVQRPEAPDALPMSVADVVAMGARRRGTRVSRADRRAAVESALDRVAAADLESRPFASLSGGQKQRVLLAQAIVRAPDVLLLDEPAAGLDRASVERVSVILREEARRGAVVVCVTHDDEAIGAADRVIRLDRGSLVA